MIPTEHAGIVTRPPHRTDAVHDVVFVVFDGIQGLDLVGPLEVFEGANKVLDTRMQDGDRYRPIVVSIDGGAVETESYLSVNTGRIDRLGRGRIGSLVIPGGLGAQHAADDTELITAVQDLADRSDRVVSVCTGAFVIAAAGLVDGKRIATHWARAGALRHRFPELDVDAEPIYVRDGDVWSSAGVTAGIDLALAIVEHDHGADVAQVVARWLVMFLRRPGGQTQFAAPVWTERATYQPVRAAQDLIDNDPGGDHRVGLLADRVGMSERHFTRRFTEETGSTPAQYVAAVRVEAARRSLEASTDTVEAIADRCGFGTAETMRRTFARRLGVSPDQYRRRFRTPALSQSNVPERNHP
jgi:transcriptional regulator GlxA family with amidase domain